MLNLHRTKNSEAKFFLEQVIEKPMDLGTIKNRMDAKDASGYQHVQEVGDDMRLVFSNAMTYNPEGSDVYVMTKTLSDKFEEKWKSLIEPKLHEEVSMFSGVGTDDLRSLVLLSRV
jgi:hypothetical protein